MASILGPTGELASETNNNNGPWWVAATLRMGVPAALACYLVYYVTSGQGGAVAEMRDDIRAIATTITSHVGSTDRSMKEIQRLLGIQCANSAKSDIDRNACFEK